MPLLTPRRPTARSSSKALAAFDLYEEYLEAAGGPTSTISTLRLPEWNTEHTFSMLTKARPARSPTHPDPTPNPNPDPSPDPSS